MSLGDYIASNTRIDDVKASAKAAMFDVKGGENMLTMFAVFNARWFRAAQVRTFVVNQGCVSIHRNTVRNALEQLVSLGFLDREGGVGTGKQVRYRRKQTCVQAQQEKSVERVSRARALRDKVGRRLAVRQLASNP